MKRIGVLTVAYCFTALASSGNGKLHFNNLSTGQGLSNKMVLCTVQDTTGFMWFGTAEGLNRYDGYEFRVFRHIPADTSSVSSSWINCLHITRSGELWVGTEKGLNIYDPVRERFVRYAAPNGKQNALSNKRIRCIYEDSAGTMWIGTLEGLVRLERETGRTDLYTFGPGRMSSEVRTICDGDGGELWIGTFDGLYRFDPAHGRHERFEARRRRAYDQSNNLISALSRSGDSLWVGTSNGLVLFDVHRGLLASYRAEESGLPDNDVKNIMRYSPGTLLIATANGLSLLDTAAGSFESYNTSPLDGTSLPDETVWCAYRDRLGVVWLGTNNGLAKLNTKRKPIGIFRTVTSDRHAMKRYMVNGALVTPDHDVWLTSNYGVMRYDSTMTLSKTYRFGQGGLSHPIAKRIMRDSRGMVWIGTNDGINYYDPHMDRFRNLSANPTELPFKYVYDIKEDADGDLVVNISSGLCFITPRVGSDGRSASFSLRRVVMDSLISSANSDVSYFDTDPHGNIWIGTISDGLFRYEKNKGRFTQYKFRRDDPTSINSDRIYSIHVDKSDAVWVGTDMGLCRLDAATGAFERFEGDIDLSKSIRGITSDEHRRIWVATLRELIMFDYEYDRKIVSDLSTDVDMGDAAYNSFFNDPRGDIYMGGYGGLIAFRPADIMLSLDKAPIAITGLYVSGNRIAPEQKVDRREILERSATLTRHITLRHNQNAIRISFALMNYASPANNVYSYRLEGYDQRSATTGDLQNSASYSNLRPGRYVFRVRGANPDGIWSDEEATLAITVKTPWWSSRWAWVVYCVLAAGVIRIVWSITATRLKLSSELRLEKMERQKMEELNAIKMQFFTNVSHEFKTPLSLILGPIESLEQGVSDPRQRGMLSMMRSNAERLLRLINQIMDMRRMDNGKMSLQLDRGDFTVFARRIWEQFAEHAARRGIVYDFSSEAAPTEMFFDSDKMDKTLYNLISNALKYTPRNGVVSVSLHDAAEPGREMIAVEVSDTGSGIPPSDQERIFDRFYQGLPSPFDDSHGSGIGLALTRDFVELHGGRISLASQYGKGSVFRFTIPRDLTPREVCQTSVPDPDHDDMESADHFAKARVVIAEDNEDMLMFLKMNLEEYYDVHTASDGEQALELVRSLSPDLVLSDVMMPRVDGFELCGRIKGDMITCHIPVIMLTARSDEQSRNEGYSCGADGYIYKPFSVKTLRTRIDKMIELRRRLQESYRRRVLSEPTALEVVSQDDRFLSQIVTVIQDNMEDPDFGIQQLCGLTSYSYQQVYRKVKALTGETINEFIRSIRLKRAAQLLTDSGLRISEIMYRVGFNSHSYFTKCFRERYGVSPREYAQREQSGYSAAIPE